MFIFLLGSIVLIISSRAAVSPGVTSGPIFLTILAISLDSVMVRPSLPLAGDEGGDVESADFVTSATTYIRDKENCIVMQKCEHLVVLRQKGKKYN